MSKKSCLKKKVAQLVHIHLLYSRKVSVCQALHIDKERHKEYNYSYQSVEGVVTLLV